MAGDGITPVFYPAVSLDGRHYEAAQKTHQRNAERHQPGLPRGKGRNPKHCGSDQRGGYYPAQKALYGFARGKPRGDFMATNGLAPHILQHVGKLHDEDKKGDEQEVFTLKTGDIQAEENGHIRHAVNRDH